jgi:hypothetical protein
MKMLSDLGNALKSLVTRQAEATTSEMEQIDAIEKALMDSDVRIEMRLQQVLNDHAHRRVRIAKMARTLADRIGRLPIEEGTPEAMPRVLRKETAA